MPRYVILTHDHPFLHWDLMLEQGGVLRTWRLLAEPAAGQTVAAERLADHRVAYLDYEGPVRGDRGIVKRWDCGSYDVANASKPERYRLCGACHPLFAELATGIEGDSWTFRAFEQRASNATNESSSESAESGCTP